MELCEERERERGMDVNVNNSGEQEILSKFMPIHLSCRSVGLGSWGLYVFWSPEEEEQSNSSVLSVKNQIKESLCYFSWFVKLDVLVQFWAPTTIMNRRFLTTSQQPFALKYMNENLIRYRKHCVGYTFGEGEGVVGRVFRNQLPELSPDMRNYSLEDHPLRDLALSYGIIQNWIFPVFKRSPHSQPCIGVLEFLFFSKTCLYYRNQIAMALYRLEHAGLITLSPREMRQQEIQKHVADEIKNAMLQVCKINGLSLACVWVRCRHSTSWGRGGGSSNMSYNDFNVRGRGDFVVSIPELLFYNFEISPRNLVVIHSLVMRVGEGLIGNAFLSDRPYLCTDVSNLKMSHYPMAHNAITMGRSCCITICLQSIATGNCDYVLEFCLSLDMTPTKDLHNLLSSMLVILNYHLKHFEVVVVDPVNKLFIEVDKFSIDSVFESLKTRPTIINEIETGALQNEGEFPQSNLLGHHLDMEGFANSGGIGGDYVDLEQRGRAIVPENNYLEKTLTIVSEEKRLEMKSKTHNQKESSCSYETLKQHFGRKLVDAAESLGVSRSTFKRYCRENGISKWPFPKRSKVTSLPPIPKQMSEPIQGNAEPISDSSGKIHSSSNVPTTLTPKGAINTVTVKATYKNDIIKFQLSFSSRMTDLVENVTLRLKLREGTFAIKYLDNEGDYVLIACDVDLQECINSSRILEQSAIKMLIEPLQ